MSRLGFTLTIVGLLSATLVLVSWYLVPALFLERSDGDEEGSQETVPQSSHEASTEDSQEAVSQYSYEDFPSGLHGTVPQYDIVSSSDDPRDCHALEFAAADCYVVATKAGDKRSWALIVEDIIREDYLEGTSDKMVEVSIYNPEPRADEEGYATAFRSKAVAEDYLSGYVQNTTENTAVIDGVFIFK